jgi:hypothetical protein
MARLPVSKQALTLVYSEQQLLIYWRVTVYGDIGNSDQTRNGNPF